MLIKSGVKIHGIQPETLLGILIVDTVFKNLNQTLTITSLLDPPHKTNSLHYQGFAFDLRTFDLKGISTFEMRDRLQEALGAQWQVILEPSHIHVEFDP